MASQLDEQTTVSAQIAPADVAAIKAQGVEVIICNRPDGEELGQPLNADIAAAAEAAGLDYHLIPIASGRFTIEAAEAFAEILATDKKIFAYCRSGTRSAGLWALANAGRMQSVKILAATAAAGYKMDGFAEYLASRD